MDNLFLQIISLENLFDSWYEFRVGKRKKEDVQVFEKNLEDSIFRLHKELKEKTYRHGNYTSFYITDPKLRHIHKAEVRDRVVHHAIYRVLYPIFDQGFIYDSYSCRNDKGTHRAVRRLETFSRKVSRNYSKHCYVLKCDIRKFFASIDHEVLKNLIRKKIKDTDTLWLVENIIDSFSENGLQNKDNQISFDFASPKGMPIGNLTSQLFANIYLHELDMFVKHNLKVKHYIRYCDDFVILSDDVFYLENICQEIKKFIESELKLSFHEDKVTIRKLSQGIDFLGYVVLPHHTVLRTKTKRRMFERVNENNQSSYLGILRHCEGYKLEQEIRKRFD